MLYLLTLTLQAIDKALEVPAARARLRKNKLGLKDEDKLVRIPELGIVLPEREARCLPPELIRRLAQGRDLYKDLQEAQIQ